MSLWYSHSYFYSTPTVGDQVDETLQTSYVVQSVFSIQLPTLFWEKRAPLRSWETWPRLNSCSLLVYMNAHKIIPKRTDTDVALHRKVFQNIKLKETCVRITKSNLTQSSNTA